MLKWGTEMAQQFSRQQRKAELFFCSYLFEVAKKFPRILNDTPVSSLDFFSSSSGNLLFVSTESRGIDIPLPATQINTKECCDWCRRTLTSEVLKSHGNPTIPLSFFGDLICTLDPVRSFKNEPSFACMHLYSLIHWRSPYKIFFLWVVMFWLTWFETSFCLAWFLPYY